METTLVISVALENSHGERAKRFVDKDLRVIDHVKPIYIFTHSSASPPQPPPLHNTLGAHMPPTHLSYGTLEQVLSTWRVCRLGIRNFLSLSLSLSLSLCVLMGMQKSI